MVSIEPRTGRGEPAITTWVVRSAAAFADQVASAVIDVRGRSAVIGIDGRSGAGKTTLANLLRDHLASAQIVHTDDVAWYQSMFGWDRLLAENVLGPLRQGVSVDYRPTAWEERGRVGAVVADAEARYTIVEGCGAIRRSLTPHLDVSIWVQSDHDEAQRRGIHRDGGTEAAAAFWREWAEQEIPFFLADRPWQRADITVCGTPPAHLPRDHVLVHAPAGRP